MTDKRPQQNITFGDLVRVDGYDGRLFFVDAWTVEYNYEPEGEWTEVWYDITCAATGEYHMAMVEDVTKVCDAAEAEEYLRKLPKRRNVFDILLRNGGETDMYGWNEYKPEPRESSAKKVKERKETIDRLLDEYADYRRLVDEFGDEEYRAKVDYLAVKLAEISKE